MINYIWIIPVLLFVSLVFWLFYKISDSFYVFVSGLRGKKIIAVRGISSAIFGDYWRAVLEPNDFNQLVAYRYPGTKIGSIRFYLDQEGRGDYCGEVEWKVIKNG